MLKVDASLNHIPAKREHVVALLESINQPLVNIPSHGTASTGAFILGTRNEHGYYTVFVYLHQPETKAVVIYVSEPRNLTAEQYQGEQDEALRFVESMGFMIDDIKFPALNPSEQESVVSRVPLFRPPERTVDLFEVADGQGSPSVPASGSHGAQPSSGPRSPLYGEPLHPGGSPNSGYGAGGVGPSSHSGYGTYGSATPFPATGSHGPLSSAGGPGVARAPGSNPAGRAQDPEALKRIGRLLSSFGWLLVWGWALLGCQTPQTTDPRAVQSHLDLATQHLARRDWPEAIRSYNRVLEMDPKNHHAAQGLGLAYYKLGKLPESEENLLEAIRWAPDWSQPKNTLAVVRIEQNRCGEALELLDQVVEDIFYPTPEYAQHNRARALECLGRTDEAMEQLESLQLRKPQFCLGYLTLSEFAFKHERYEETIRACNGFVRHCEEDDEIRSKILPKYSAMCYYRKGVAYAELGDVESARASFIRCEATGASLQGCRTRLNRLPP